MDNSIKDLQYDKVLKILEEFDLRLSFDRIKKIPDESSLKNALSNHLKNTNFGKKSILGVDIRQYGSFDDFEQPLIPILYRILFEETINHCLGTQEFLFQKYDKDRILKQTIDTGDGGYLIFDTPLHSLLFASSFAFILRLFNSYHLFPKLRTAIGEINLRYAITYDRLYSIQDNYYGRSIINNSRIIGKDTLNRCLMDEGSYQWFLLNIDGLENLQVLSINEIANIDAFQSYDQSIIVSGKNDFFEEKDNTRNFGIINSDLLKVGMIHSKNTILNVYNVHLQVSIVMHADDADKIRTITISLGNLNTMGI
jgi:hypothetical protein